jgi:hypothetical protein
MCEDKVLHFSYILLEHFNEETLWLLVALKQEQKSRNSMVAKLTLKISQKRSCPAVWGLEGSSLLPLGLPSHNSWQLSFCFCFWLGPKLCCDWGHAHWAQSQCHCKNRDPSYSVTIGPIHLPLYLTEKRTQNIFPTVKSNWELMIRKLEALWKSRENQQTF